MIGQKYVIGFVDNLIEKEYMPRFGLVVGDKGSGRRTLCNHIANKLGGNHYIVPDVRIATIRDVIENSYKQKTPMLYIIPNIDDMSKEAQNAILKITEEPPNKAYFLMTIEDINNVLPTIKSRAYTIWMDRYTKEEIAEYVRATYYESVVELCTGICETPGEVDILMRRGAEKFYGFVDKVVDNVDKAPLGNALKILDSLDLKDEGKGYDINLFLKIFVRCCLQKSTTFETMIHYLSMVEPTSTALTELKVKGANRIMILLRAFVPSTVIKV